MESPKSAFSIYKSNPKPKQNKKKRKKSSPTLQSLQNISNHTLVEAARKLKIQKKDSKKITKQKSHKKKRTKPSRSDVKLKERPSQPVELEEMPTFEPPPPERFQLPTFADIRDLRSPRSSESFDFEPVTTDSVEEGLKAFNWMIAPYNSEEFLNNIWERKPLYISRKSPNYYKELISTPVIDKVLRTESIEFTKNIDITSYVDGKRETHNPEGKAHPHLVWDYYLNGCSIRMLNPQTYITKLHMLNSILQELFNSFVGANAYLTPPDSQGFAPHYDDIEAFILQAEGKKKWRVYKPLTENEILPRVSSKNFDQDEIGEPFLEVTLEAGDLLYFPRGYIHQGVTIDGEHSLHVTVSMYQKHSWADLFEKMIPAALHTAINENVELRSGLPFDLYEHFGLVHSDSNSPRRAEIVNLIMGLFDKIRNHLPIDDAVDQMAKNYQHDALPPILNDMEKAVTVFGDTDVMIENGRVINRVEIGLETKIRLLRKNILRMVSEDKIRLYYYVENSLEYHGNELTFIDIDEEMAPAIDNLINTYPEYIAVENLDIANDADKLQLADALWSRGLLMTEYPLETIED